MKSTRVVLPWSTWATMATLRIFSRWIMGSFSAGKAAMYMPEEAPAASPPHLHEADAARPGESAAHGVEESELTAAVQEGQRLALREMRERDQIGHRLRAVRVGEHGRLAGRDLQLRGRDAGVVAWGEREPGGQ